MFWSKLKYRSVVSVSGRHVSDTRHETQVKCRKNIDFSLKKCCTDRLSSLPDELICQILSSLPTKDAAIVSLSSKKMRRSAFMYLTTLHFDDSPVSYHDWNPQINKRFQIFKTFVNNVLHKSHSPHLSKFILGFGGDIKLCSPLYYGWSEACDGHCFPDMEATMLNAWICFPLSRGVREIDLRILVRKTGKLPSALFTCETLEVLKLDTNFAFELASSMPSIRLPNLKVLQLHSVTIIPEDDFVIRLLSNCPSLQELCIDCRWQYGKSVVISSPSLQKLVLLMNNDFKSKYKCELLLIDTPNLQYFEYEDKLALYNSLTSMTALVQASINIIDYDWGSSEECFRESFNFVQAVCNVQHLSLPASCLQIDTNSRRKWDDTVLFEFLRRLPVLEVLEFPVGIDPWSLPRHDFDYQKMIVEFEPWFLRKNKISRFRCMPHLKRIIIKKYRGTMREIELVRFFLEFAPDLEELSVICDRNANGNIPGLRPLVDLALAERTLKKFPKASSTCLLTVQ